MVVEVTDEEFVAKCEQAAELLTSLMKMDGVSICGSDQTFGIDMHGEQVDDFILLLGRAAQWKG